MKFVGARPERGVRRLAHVLQQVGQALDQEVVLRDDVHKKVGRDFGRLKTISLVLNLAKFRK